MITVKIYDTNMNLKAVLENAFAVGYEQRLNEVGTAHFSLPADDPKVTECQSFRFVEIYDNDEKIDLYRIMPDKIDRTDDGIFTTFECEHVLATLMDDILFQYNPVPTGIYTALNDQINFILTAQTTFRWEIGINEFSATFTYNFENENLLSALFSIPKAFEEDYVWSWDTTSLPWQLNLLPPGITSALATIPSFNLIYRKNIKSIERETDPRGIITKLYPLGAGEGVNQLTIRRANGGIPYITASTTAYGTISGFFVDKTETNTFTLLGKARTELDKISIPRVTYRINGADVSKLTGESIFQVGASVIIKDEDLGIDISAQIVSITKDNISEAEWDTNLEISNKVRDLATNNTVSLNRQRISDVYSQGATNIDTNYFQVTADNTNPSFWQFYVSDTIISFNKCMLSTDTVSIFASASVSLMNTYIDGNLITATQSINLTDYDILPFLNMTDNRVRRGEWHTINLIPDNPATINAQVVKQFSVSSQGGGDF